MDSPKLWGPGLECLLSLGRKNTAYSPPFCCYPELGGLCLLDTLLFSRVDGVVEVRKAVSNGRWSCLSFSLLSKSIFSFLSQGLFVYSFLWAKYLGKNGLQLVNFEFLGGNGGRGDNLEARNCERSGCLLKIGWGKVTGKTNRISISIDHPASKWHGYLLLHWLVGR